MRLFEWIRDWLSNKFDENLESIKDNHELIKENWRNILFSLFVIWLGFYVLSDYSFFSIFFYSITAIWVIFFNTLILVKKPYYFYFTLVIILVAGAVIPLLIDSFNFAISGNWLMALVYFGVWVSIRARFYLLREEN